MHVAHHCMRTFYHMRVEKLPKGPDIRLFPTTHLDESSFLISLKYQQIIFLME